MKFFKITLFLFITVLLSPLNAEEIEPVIYVLDPKILNELENSGYSLSEMLGHEKKIRFTQELYQKMPQYRSFANTVGQPIKHHLKTDQLPHKGLIGSGDIPNMVNALRGFEDKGKRSPKDKKGGYKISELSNNSHYPYEVEYDGDEPRHFDPRWLYSPIAEFKLIGLSNRVDRKDFHKNSCGEVRLIYRLSYQSKTSASSLPFFLNVVRMYPFKKNCQKIAQLWHLPQLTTQALREGPLNNTLFHQLELNFQSLRFTSGYMQGFGGQAMYMQRIFKNSDGRLRPIPLENTPNVLALVDNTKLFRQFIDFLKKPKNLTALDLGYLNINFNPDFLARLSVSWSTLGRARTANRPYSKLYHKFKNAFDSIDITGLKNIKSTQGLVERLNNLSCAGCHQSGGTAGFHFLGLSDDQFSHPFNRQQLGLSPHSRAEISRRRAYLKILAKGGQPNLFRPHSILHGQNWDAKVSFKQGNVGSLCFLDNKHIAGSSRCESQVNQEVRCIKTVSNSSEPVLIGECVLTKRPQAGNVCWKGQIREDSKRPQNAKAPLPTFNFYAFQDKWQLTGALLKTRGSYKCVLPQSGAPLGRMSRRCTLAEEKFSEALKKRLPTEVCANQGGAGFDRCAASGNAGACLESLVARAMLDVCHPERSCREDYICQRFPNYGNIKPKYYNHKKNSNHRVTPAEINVQNIRLAQNRQMGFCVPTYFLFNMRVDGHPHPLTGASPRPPISNPKKPLRGYQ